MTQEGMPVTAEVAAEPINGLAFLVQHGLEGIAGEQFEAHGRVINVVDAIENCSPLVGMISSLMEDLKDVPGHEDQNA